MLCALFLHMAVDSPSLITSRLINVHCVTPSLWEQQHPVGGIHVHGMRLETCPVSDNESELKEQILLECILLCEETETSHLRNLKVV